jgi:hypothetical protein
MFVSRRVKIFCTDISLPGCKLHCCPLNQKEVHILIFAHWRGKHQSATILAAGGIFHGPTKASSIIGNGWKTSLKIKPREIYSKLISIAQSKNKFTIL